MASTSSIALASALLVASVAPRARAQGQDEPGPSLVTPSPFSDPMPVDRGWSVEAAWVGFASALAILGAGITAAALAQGEPDASVALGASSMGLLAVAGPVVALGGASARTHPLVPGSAPVRWASWIAWGLSLALGATLITIAATNDPFDPDPVVGLVGPCVAGALAVFGLSFDALVSAIQVDLVSGRR